MPQLRESVRTRYERTLHAPSHRTLELANRIVIAPMCAALLTIEATAVLPEARITYADVGLCNDATEAALSRTLQSVQPRRRPAEMRLVRHGDNIAKPLEVEGYQKSDLFCAAHHEG